MSLSFQNSMRNPVSSLLTFWESTPAPRPLKPPQVESVIEDEVDEEQEPDAAENGLELCRQREAKEAEPLLRLALEERREKFGPSHVASLTCANNLACLLAHLGRHDEAHRLAKETHSLAEATLGSEHRCTFKFAGNVANLLCNMGRYAEAEPLARSTVAVKERIFGLRHPSTLTSTSNLASLLCNWAAEAPTKEDASARRQEAEALHRNILSTRQEVLGPDHLSTLISMNNLCNLMIDMGQHKEAVDLLRETAETAARAWGSEHFVVLALQHALARALVAGCDEGDIASIPAWLESMKWYRAVLTSREKTLGFSHPDTLASARDLAACLRRKGALHEAEPLLRRTLAETDGILGHDHPNTVACAAILVKLLQEVGKNSEAAMLQKRFIIEPEQVKIGGYANTRYAMDFGIEDLEKEVLDRDIDEDIELYSRRKKIPRAVHNVLQFMRMGFGR